jgi:hypothetical protein
MQIQTTVDANWKGALSAGALVLDVCAVFVGGADAHDVPLFMHVYPGRGVQANLTNCLPDCPKMPDAEQIIAGAGSALLYFTKSSASEQRDTVCVLRNTAAMQFTAVYRLVVWGAVWHCCG